jgi:ATP phosphoribosyltransferase
MKTRVLSFPFCRAESHSSTQVVSEALPSVVTMAGRWKPTRPCSCGSAYELLDLRFGPCVMVVASVAGEDRAEEALRRLGVMRIATKYPRIAQRDFERTGRQAEIVEVKGSVELAPLTGLAEGIVDLTATGTTLRENGLVVREEILASTARLIANPVAHKLRAAEIDDVVARLREALGGG